jgi:hypothetical protein
MGHFMFDTSTTALLRAVLDAVCESVSLRESGVRTHVAAKILEAATSCTSWAAVAISPSTRLRGG